ncbi:hypothetical protein PVV74_17185 [Roseovarius sp. SK2]|uniref:hypothetical protein n=1 Tax=Roseovarius TaxID=74030 RepID=UPI00237A929B|nr:hypothetical protein [Roseovarius sp. SK2]MDD9727197.1 hypothetical protein [Roseovarius sp. SK2]
MKVTAHDCNKAFDDAEREFGDRSTEFLAQIAGDRLGVEAHEILDGIASLSTECGGTIPFGYSDDKASV